MARYLRKIESHRWGDIPTGEYFPADPINDLSTDENALSIWRVESDEEILDVAAAMSYKRTKVNGFDFVLFDEGVLRDLGLVHSQKKGGTGIERLDMGHHFDVVDLTANKLCDLARRLKTAGEIDSKFPKEIALRIKVLLESGVLNPRQMGGGWQKFVGDFR